MILQDTISFHCASDFAHQRLVSNFSEHLINLRYDHSVHIYSRNESITSNSSEYSEINEYSLNISEVIKHLNSQWLGHTILYLDRASTTQETLRGIVPWCENGWVALTGNQTSGRGRRGTTWLSPAGSVAFSIALQIEAHNAQRLTFIQYIAALAVVEVMKNPEWNGMRLKLKWPNDIFKDGVKVGGVLCEGSSRKGMFHIVVGVGINITNPQPTACLVPDKEGIFREIFVGQYLTAFEILYDQMCERGFEAAVKEKYLDSWMHTNQRVCLGGADGPTATVRGLAPNGWVRVFRDDLHAFQDLPPEDTSLDVKNNIISQKGT